MRTRPPTVTVAVILLVLVSVTDFPLPWAALFPGAEPPDFVVYAGIVLGILGLVVAVGLWQLKRWSFWATIVVAALNILLAAPGVVELPNAALAAAIAATAIAAAIVIVLVVLPDSRRALRGAAGPSSA